MNIVPSLDLITRISWRGFRIPFRAEFRAAHGVMTAREGFVVEVAAASGARGFGEASPLPSFAGGSLNETAIALEILARAALGHAPGDAWKSCAAIPGLAPGSLAAARCGVETAIGDLAARQSGTGLGVWLAARAGLPLGSSRSAIPVNAIIDAESPTDAGEAVTRAVADGFPAVKLKVGGDPASDAARVEAARDAGGAALELRVDANRAWSGADARTFLAAASMFDISLCEEPLASVPDHFVRLAALRRETSVPVGIDESCPSAEHLSRAIAAGAADAIVIKPMVTGLAETLAMLRLAGEHSLRVIVTTTFDTGIATALAAHLAALIPGEIVPCGLATLGHLEHALVCDPPLIRGGMMRVPERAGIGVDLDLHAMERYATGHTVEVMA